MQQENPGNMHGVDMAERKSCKQLRQKSTYLKDTNSSAGLNSSLDIYDKFPGGISAYNGNRKNRMSSKHGHYGRKITSEPTTPWLNESDKVRIPKIGQRSKASKSVKYSETHDTERGLFTMIERVLLYALLLWYQKYLASNGCDYFLIATCSRRRKWMENLRP